MRLSTSIYVLGIFVAACVLSIFAATLSSDFIEMRSKEEVRSALMSAGMEWAETDADGLQVFIHGNAPDEGARFTALAIAGQVVDAERLIDQMTVFDTISTKPPEFLVTLIRNRALVSAIGVIPSDPGHDPIISVLKRIAKTNQDVHTLLDAVDYQRPAAWNVTLDYALSVMEDLEISKIKVKSGTLLIEGLAKDSENAKRIESKIKSRAPKDVLITVRLNAPRQIISPFTFQIETKDGQTSYGSCSVYDFNSYQKIQDFADKLGAKLMDPCAIGLGQPSPNWNEAVENVIDAASQLQDVKITLSDLETTLVAGFSVEQAQYDKVVAKLSADLPDEFVLSAIKLDPPLQNEERQSEFVATLSPEGLLQIRGFVSDSAASTLIDSFAQARFGVDRVTLSTRVDDSLGSDWTLRVMAGLEALSELVNGVLVVTSEQLTLKGRTYSNTASVEIAKLFEEKLGQRERTIVELDYVEPPKPENLLLSNEECLESVNSLLVTRKINFEPGSDRVDLSGQELLDDIAVILEQCDEIALEIAGHTDSQGREQMNQQLSQSRATAVLMELQRRRILTTNFVATGYGEIQPIASNDTEEGRETNRRIEFNLIQSDIDEQSKNNTSDPNLTGTEAENGQN